MTTNDTPVQDLAPLIGEWSIEARFDHPAAPPPDDTRGRVSFEWMPGGAFVIQRWEIPVPEAPDGLAVLGPHEDRESLVQHYFDSRGVHRVYETTLEDGVWRLWRGHPGFDQRFAGTFSEDGSTIEGAWELRTDGETWKKDFGLVYTRVA